MDEPAPVITARGLSKTYGSGDAAVRAVRDVELTVAAGSFSVVMGHSGSGKTTLLNLLGGLDEPTAGEVRLDGVNISVLADDERAEIRRDGIGFIFQGFGLLPTLSAAENVEVPLRMVKTDPAARRERSRTLLEMVGLWARSAHRPHELSGGEQQRVVIARALANRPRLLLADEPTGQLDSRTGAEIIEVLAALVESHGIAAFVATHDQMLLTHADQVMTLRDGTLVPAG